MHFGCFSTAMFMNVLRWGRETRRARADLATFNSQNPQGRIFHGLDDSLAQGFGDGTCICVYVQFFVNPLEVC